MDKSVSFWNKKMNIIDVECRIYNTYYWVYLFFMCLSFIRGIYGNSDQLMVFIMLLFVYAIYKPVIVRAFLFNFFVKIRKITISRPSINRKIKIFVKILGYIIVICTLWTLFSNVFVGCVIILMGIFYISIAVTNYGDAYAKIFTGKTFIFLMITISMPLLSLALLKDFSVLFYMAISCFSIFGAFVIVGLIYYLRQKDNRTIALKNALMFCYAVYYLFKESNVAYNVIVSGLILGIVDTYKKLSQIWLNHVPAELRTKNMPFSRTNNQNFHDQNNEKNHELDDSPNICHEIQHESE